MREIGARELKASLSQTLHDVARGERVRVTVRGRAVADLVPTGASPAEEKLRELAAAGRVVPAARAKPKRAPRLIKGRGSASALILSERDDER
jgi:prevent-host-death family protein